MKTDVKLIGAMPWLVHPFDFHEIRWYPRVLYVVEEGRSLRTIYLDLVEESIASKPPSLGGPRLLHAVRRYDQ